MSDHIPFEIQVEIIKKLPIKSVIQFRSVSKRWKSVIDSSAFIADYTVLNHAQPQHLLVSYYTPSSEETYVSIVADNTFPQNKSNPPVPLSIDLLWHSFIVGTSHGLICLFGFYRNQEAMAVLWNPSIRKSVAIAVGVVDRFAGGTVLGFGVCPATSDPKIVKITDTHTRKMKGVTCSSYWQVEVYSLSSKVWRSSFGNMSDKLVEFTCPRSQVAIGGHCYWCGLGNTVGSDTTILFILSFNLLSEEFEEIYLPNELAFRGSVDLHLLKLRSSLSVLQEWIMDDIIEVWMMMENGGSKSFIKLFTITKLYPYSFPCNFGGIVNYDENAR